MQTPPQTKTVWIGDLDGFEDESYFSRIFSPLFQISSFKIFKDPNSKGHYAFVDFSTPEQARLAISLYHGKPRPFSNKSVKKNLQAQLWSISAKAKRFR